MGWVNPALKGGYMSVVNFYRDASSYTAISIAELGDITSGGSSYNEAFSQISGCDVVVYLNDYINPDDINATCINFSGDSSAINYYSNSNLQNGFSNDGYINQTTGFLLHNLILNNSSIAFVRASYEDYSMTYRPTRVYLAFAKVNGTLRFGFLGINDRVPSSPGFDRWNAFVTNSTWSDSMIEEMKIIDTSNPYYEGGYSQPGGGDPNKQNWSETSDVVKADLLPDETHYGAQACGLITIFSPSDTQLRYLADIIWGNGFFQFMQNLVENISDLFISFGMVPFTVDKGATVEVTWFDFAISGQQVGTGIYLDKVANQFIEMDMGTIMLDGSDNRIFATDSVLDYSPYSRLGIYLPFIGYQELDIDECRNNSLHLIYRIDILSGTVVAIIRIQERDIYQFTGNCLTQLPLTSMDAQTMISNAVNIGIAAAGAGATGAVASAGDALTAENLANGDITAAGAELQNAQRAMQVSNAGGSLAAATANGMMGMKPNFKKSGGIGASASLISVMQPYLFLTTPRQSMPDNYNKVCGFPCNIGGNLGDFEGFTVVEDIRLNGLVATSPEVEEIYQLLKSGVII